MLRKSAALLGACLVAVAGPPLAQADPVVQPVVDTAPAPPVPAAPLAPIASAIPGTLTTPDGWVLTVQARNESMEPVASLTNAPWNREYLVDGSFEGTVTGAGKTKLAGGSLEAGYQIGCGIGQEALEAGFIVGGLAGVGLPFATGSIFPFLLGANASDIFKIGLSPGKVYNIPVTKKTFKGTKTHVNITGLRIKVDGCAGQSFIRSFATFTSSTDNTDDVVTYVGVTRAV